MSGVSQRAGDPIRVGVIGCGRAALDLHLPTLAALEDAQAVAIADPDRAALDHAGERFGIARTVTDHSELLADDGIDVVCVAAPSHLHAEIGLDALEAGKHLMVEKPLALGLEDCDRLVEAAAAAGVRAAVGYNLRLHPHVLRARELISSGALGRVSLLSSTFASPSLLHQVPPWRADPERGGGLLALQAVHHLDLWRHLLGQEVVEVRCAEGAPAGGSAEAPGSVAISAVTSGGVAIAGSFSAVTGQENDFAVYGTDAWLRASLYRFDSLESLPRDATAGDAGRQAARPVRFLAELLRALPRLRRGGDFQASYLAEWADFVRAVRTGSPVSCTFEDAREANRILSAVFESARSGTAVAVADAPQTLAG
jgi:predicted dehydrogenase